MTTTYMSLSLPNPSVTSGPEWATALNTALTSIDSHDHSSGSGNAITQTGINLTGNLEFNTYNAVELGACTFENLAESIATAVSIYVSNGEFYFTDNAGNSVQITSNGAINAAGIGGIGGDYASTDNVSLTYDAITFTYTFTDGNNVRSFINAVVRKNFTTYSSAQTLDIHVDDVVLVSGNTVLTLPVVADSDGAIMKIKKTDSNATITTITGAGAETIDGDNTLVMYEQYESIHIVCDGSVWYVI